ncbi:PilZ domain-containing protein [Ferrimonas aestuarii]|uniref:Pilus assembly protein PilZ n=1 Tax=Ferrimonas aestuarii TaxID=2569539 RepID=A0A4U1BTZ8_9GAMM|nr:PilZ domain-containing protein [Ferrimonas aestuarii]TKB57495.1 pilus assembly protein PilZ [Ferrimonas aestuarii]
MDCVELDITTLEQLYQAYMGRVQSGGLYFPSQTLWPLGTELLCRFRLPQQANWHEYVGRVVWVNPQTTSHADKGVGVAFGDSAFKPPIEQLLADRLATSKLTSTL